MGKHKHSSKSANLPDDLWEELKTECRLRKVTLVQALTEAIKMWLAN